MITIRLAEPTDRELIIAGNQKMALETESRTLDELTVTKGVDTVFADPTKGQYYIAEVDGKPAGQLMITTEWSDWRNRDFWWIQSVYILPEFRRNGVYSAMHRKIRELAQENGSVCGIRLYVDEDNIRAQKTYHSQGMIQARYLMFEEDWVL